MTVQSLLDSLGPEIEDPEEGMYYSIFFFANIATGSTSTKDEAL